MPVYDWTPIIDARNFRYLYLYGNPSYIFILHGRRKVSDLCIFAESYFLLTFDAHLIGREININYLILRRPRWVRRVHFRTVRYEVFEDGEKQRGKFVSSIGK